MKHFSLVLNIVLLVAVGVLYFLFFKEQHTHTSTTPNGKKDIPNAFLPSKVGFFDMDSLERNYTYIKDIRDQLKNKEQEMSNELNTLKRTFTERAQELQQKSQTMNATEGQAAQEEINQMQQKFQAKEAELTQQHQNEQFKMVQGINKKIEDFLKTFNQDKKYAFIFSHTPGDFIYYKDSLFDITTEMVAGLNLAEKKPK